MIEEAKDTDLPALAALLAGLQALHVREVPHLFHADTPAASLGAVLAAAMREGGRVLLYRTEGVPRGYLLWRREDQTRDALRREMPRAVLDHVAVTPAWRRRGVARRLMARFEAEIAREGCVCWVSNVHVFNRASEALMHSAGATPLVTRFERRLGCGPPQRR